MKRQFKVSGYYVEDMLTVIYLQFVDNYGEKCRLLEKRYSTAGHSYTYTTLKARKIHDTEEGDNFIIFRGRRLYLREFIAVGGPWSSLPINYTIEY